MLGNNLNFCSFKNNPKQNIINSINKNNNKKQQEKFEHNNFI